MRKHRLETLLYQRMKRNYTKVRAGKSRQINEQRTLRLLFLELASVGGPCSRTQNPRAQRHKGCQPLVRRQPPPMLITKAIIPIRDLTSIYTSSHCRTKANHTYHRLLKRPTHPKKPLGPTISTNHCHLTLLKSSHPHSERLQKAPTAHYKTIK